MKKRRIRCAALPARAASSSTVLSRCSRRSMHCAASVLAFPNSAKRWLDGSCGRGTGFDNTGACRRFNSAWKACSRSSVSSLKRFGSIDAAPSLSPERPGLASGQNSCHAHPKIRRTDSPFNTSFNAGRNVRLCGVYHSIQVFSHAQSTHDNPVHRVHAVFPFKGPGPGAAGWPALS